MVKRQKDVILDIGGGWTAFHEIINSTPLVPQLTKLGIKVVVVYMLGTELADADYLQDLQEKRRFLPGHSIIVMNRGLLPLGYTNNSHFDKIRQTQAVMNATVDKSDEDGGIYFLPELDGMGWTKSRIVGCPMRISLMTRMSRDILPAVFSIGCGPKSGSIALSRSFWRKLIPVFFPTCPKVYPFRETSSDHEPAKRQADRECANSGTGY
ncbi:hypothetical protein NBRC3280_3167 [Acetobacter pasteurianus NBRC 3280]|uniref:Uncharacterized protein n=1 Tax=Acetobacter pasteurianus NBRC 3278 TaxID=1226660 RepID=A0A401X868_ACEPA|nr:hypothetical protein [Acetobacter pasteurianus]GCD60552.1 hypothetical protein NBRC3277_3127 [Acetobacter pasteurianus NBRC 3277]GCD64112.1 hypothetical protein NBRC3278_3205 [Acetobacter pasteurianus NBRC 3278]GCD70532.1 hypothetical protein NBRC3280_3167 [Acetobacter pasteurianus NBRC 3280]